MKNSLTLKVLINVIKKNTGFFILLLVTVFSVVIISLVPPQLLRQIIDSNLILKTEDGLAVMAAAYLGVIFLIGVFDFLKEAVLTILGQKITKEIRYEMMAKKEKINARFFTANTTGAIVSRFTNDVEAVNSLFTGGIVGMIIDCFKIIGIVFSIWVFSARLGIITLLLLPVIYMITRLFQKKMLSAQIKNRILTGKVNNCISESLKNIQMIKVFSKEDYMEKNYVEVLSDNYKTIEKVNFYDSVFSPIILLIRAVLISIIVILCSGQLNLLGISLGMIAASIELISNLFSPIENLGMELQSIQQAISGIRRVNDFYNEQEDKPKSSFEAKDLDVKNTVLSFNNVCFEYEEGTSVLQNINLTVKAKEKVTFTGRTGVGKTTLFKLIMGLAEPTCGSITINGIDVYSIKSSEKRKIFGYADQSFHMIKGTVAEQVSMQFNELNTDEQISREQIEQAIDFVGLSDFVLSLENGFDTYISNENMLSQGQKQLLSIARAIVTNPFILLLDEITANLDSVTEEKIMSILKKAGSKYTILSVSHRLSSMTACDTVVILENGKIISVGSPQALLQNDDWYKSHVQLEKLTWN